MKLGVLVNFLGVSRSQFRPASPGFGRNRLREHASAGGRNAASVASPGEKFVNGTHDRVAGGRPKLGLTAMPADAGASAEVQRLAYGGSVSCFIDARIARRTPAS